MAEKTLSDLFLAHLKDIYCAEKKIYRTLPTMVKAANDAELKKAFTTHREETQGQIERLEQVFEMIGKRPPGQAVRGDQWHRRRGRGDDRRIRRKPGDRYRSRRSRPGGRTLRDGPLRRACRMGDAARHEGRRIAAQPNLARGNERGKTADANCEEQG